MSLRLRDFWSDDLDEQEKWFWPVMGTLAVIVSAIVILIP